MIFHLSSNISLDRLRVLRRRKSYKCTSSDENASIRKSRPGILQEIFPEYGKDSGWSVPQTLHDDPVTVMLATRGISKSSLITQSVERLITRVASGDSVQAPSTEDEEAFPILPPRGRKRSQNRQENKNAEAEPHGLATRTSMSSVRLDTDGLLSILRKDRSEIKPRYPSNVPPEVRRALRIQRGGGPESIQPTANSVKSARPAPLVGSPRAMASPYGSREADIVREENMKSPRLDINDANNSIRASGSSEEIIDGSQSATSNSKESRLFSRLTHSTFRNMAASAAGMVEASLPDMMMFSRQTDINASLGSSAASLNSGEPSIQIQSVGLVDLIEPNNPLVGSASSDSCSRRKDWDYKASRGVRSDYRQRALWVMEEPSLGLPQDHPDFLEACKRMNKLLSQYVQAESSTWRDVTQIVKDFGPHIGPLTLGRILRALSEKVSSRAVSSEPFTGPARIKRAKGIEGAHKDFLSSVSRCLYLVAIGVKQYSPGDVASVLYGLSLIFPAGAPRMKKADYIINALLDRLCQVAPKAAPRSISVIFYSMVQLGCKPHTLPPHLLSLILLAASETKLTSFTHQELSSFAYSLTLLGLCPSPKWMEMYLGHVQGRINEMDQTDMVQIGRMISARSKWQDHFMPQRSFMEVFLRSSGQLLPSFAPFQLTGFMVSLAYLGYSPDTNWVKKLREHITSPTFSSDISPNEASVLLGSLASLRCRPDLLVDVIHVLISAVVREEAGHSLTSRVLSRTIGALSSLVRQMRSAVSETYIEKETLDDFMTNIENVISDRLVPKIYEFSTALSRKEFGNENSVFTSSPLDADRMDLFLWLQLTSGILDLCGSSVSKLCIIALEDAIEHVRAGGCTAPLQSWQRLADAYQGAGLCPMNPALIRDFMIRDLLQER